MSKELIVIEEGYFETGETIKVTIEGDSTMPYYNNDLKVKAILTLLNSIDIKDYADSNIQDEAYKSADEIIKSTKAAFGLYLFE